MTLSRYLKLSLLSLTLCGVLTMWVTPRVMQILWSLEFFQKNPFLTWVLFSIPLVLTSAVLLSLAREFVNPLSDSEAPYWPLRVFSGAFGLCILVLVGSAAFLPQSLSTLKVACLVLFCLWWGLLAFCTWARLALR